MSVQKYLVCYRSYDEEGEEREEVIEIFAHSYFGARFLAPCREEDIISVECAVVKKYSNY